METKELLLHLTKKLESKEILLGADKEWFALVDKEGNELIKLGKNDIDLDFSCSEEGYKFDDYEEEWNNTFKENFYKSKGINCWASKCPNKVCVKEGDHKKVKIFCGEKHTRILCIECSKQYE